jgi:hypothetical protein
VFVHLVKLVDEADATVGEHQCAALKRPFAGDGVLGDGGCEPHRAGALACCVHRTRRCGLCVLEELRLGRAGIPNQQDVDVAPAAPEGLSEHGWAGAVHALTVVLQYMRWDG